MNTQKMVVKHLVLNLYSRPSASQPWSVSPIHGGGYSCLPFSITLASYAFGRGLSQRFKHEVMYFQNGILKDWQRSVQLTQFDVNGVQNGHFGPKMAINGSLIKVSKWFEIVPNDQYNLLLSFRTIWGLFGPVWTFSNKKRASWSKCLEANHQFLSHVQMGPNWFQMVNNMY